MNPCTFSSPCWQLVTWDSMVPPCPQLFWFNVPEIDFDPCLIQMFFIHVFTFIESGILFTMVFDHYVTVFNPLRQTTVLMNSTIDEMGIRPLLWAVAVIFPGPFIKQLIFWKTNVLLYSYCLHTQISSSLVLTTASIASMASLSFSSPMDWIPYALSFLKILSLC